MKYEVPTTIHVVLIVEAESETKAMQAAEEEASEAVTFNLRLAQRCIAAAREASEIEEDAVVYNADGQPLGTVSQYGGAA